MSCEICGAAVDQPWHIYCRTCFVGQPSGLSNWWTHPEYGPLVDSPTLQDVIVKMHQRVLGGLAPNLKKVDAVRLLDYFMQVQPSQSELQSPSPVWAEQIKER